MPRPADPRSHTVGERAVSERHHRAAVLAGFDAPRSTIGDDFAGVNGSDPVAFVRALARIGVKGGSRCSAALVPPRAWLRWRLGASASPEPRRGSWPARTRSPVSASSAAASSDTVLKAAAVRGKRSRIDDRADGVRELLLGLFATQCRPPRLPWPARRTAGNDPNRSQRAGSEPRAVRPEAGPRWPGIRGRAPSRPPGWARRRPCDGDAGNPRMPSQPLQLCARPALDRGSPSLPSAGPAGGKPAAASTARNTRSSLVATYR